MNSKLRHGCARLALVVAACLLASPHGYSQLDGSVVSDLRERLSKTGVFFRADAPRSLRNSGDEYVPLFVEIINGVEQEAHTTGSSVSNLFRPQPLDD